VTLVSAKQLEYHFTVAQHTTHSFVWL